MTKFLTVPMLSLKAFRFDRAAGTLTAEASTARFEKTARLFADAADEGIAVRSHHTGAVARFALTKTLCDAEGDVTAWEFTPVDAPAGSKVKKLVVFND